MKRLYRVQLNEIHHSTWDVEATSEQDAVNEVLDGSGELLHTEYAYTPISLNDQFSRKHQGSIICGSTQYITFRERRTK